MSKNKNGESEIVFNVVMRKEIPLDNKVYEQLAGLYDMGQGRVVEFTRNDDLLSLKFNGQLFASLHYIGNNTFEGVPGDPKATFDIQKDGSVQVVVVGDDGNYKGKKYLKYR